MVKRGKSGSVKRIFTNRSLLGQHWYCQLKAHSGLHKSVHIHTSRHSVALVLSTLYCAQTVIHTQTGPATATASVRSLCQYVSVATGTKDLTLHSQSIKPILGKPLFLPYIPNILYASWLSPQMWRVSGETERDKERGWVQEKVFSKCLNRLLKVVYWKWNRKPENVPVSLGRRDGVR